MVEQIVFTLRARSRGIHLVTSEIIGRLPALPEKGLLHLLIRHTSAALALNENAAVIVGASLTVPISAHRLNLGTWQGLYLCEFRDAGGPREIVATIIG